MSTDLQSTGEITLDPTLPFGLVKTTTKTVTYTKSEYPSISNVISKSFGAINSDVLKVTNFNIPTGVTFKIESVKIRVKILSHTASMYIINKDVDYEASGWFNLGFKKAGATTNFSALGTDLIWRHYDSNLNLKRSGTIPSGGDSQYIGADEIDDGDIIELEVPLEPDIGLHIYCDGSFSYSVEIEAFVELTVSMRHDGSLERGSSIVSKFDLVDENLELLESYEIEGIVSPYDFSTHHFHGTYKAGVEITYETKVGTWSLKAGVSGVYSRFRIEGVKIGDTNLSASDLPNYFDKLGVGISHKDEYGDIVAFPSLTLPDIDTLPKDSLDESLPDGKGGDCNLWLNIAPKRIPEFVGKRITITTSLWVVM